MSIRTTIITALTLAFVALPAVAQDAPAEKKKKEDPPALTLDQLLLRVQQGTVQERAEADQRVRNFRATKSRQAQLLREAKAEQGRQERIAERLEETFEENEIRIGGLNKLLKDRQGTLAELFGVVKQSSDDLKGVVQDSIVSAQYPGRHEFLGGLAQKRELPKVEELEQLWYEYLREIAESGKVVRFIGSVSTDHGIEEREIVRVGAFNLVSDGDYLAYSGGKIEELGAQPAGHFTSSAEDLQDADEGYEDFGIDPSRGQILNLLVERPSLMDRFNQGGYVGYTIAIIGVLGLALVGMRWADLMMVGNKVNAQIKTATANRDNPLGRVMAVYDDNKSVDVETLELKLDEAILKDAPAVERGLPIIKVISVVAPLMGLLGTVTGMINTFQAITLYGTGDPKIMAGGISQALVTTVLGLVVAIPMTLLYTLVAARARRIVHVLEEQAAGIVALHAEKQS